MLSFSVRSLCFLVLLCKFRFVMFARIVIASQYTVKSFMWRHQVSVCLSVWASVPAEAQSKRAIRRLGEFRTRARAVNSMTGI